MRHKEKHNKLSKRGGTSFIGNGFTGFRTKEVRSQFYSSAYAASLPHAELCQYLHGIITSNLPYYTALARYRSRRFRIPRTRQDYKNHKLLSRLTVSGLTMLKTQFAKKPKNPV